LPHYLFLDGVSGGFHFFRKSLPGLVGEGMYSVAGAYGVYLSAFLSPGILKLGRYLVARTSSGKKLSNLGYLKTSFHGKTISIYLCLVLIVLQYVAIYRKHMIKGILVASPACAHPEDP